MRTILGRLAGALVALALTSGLAAAQTKVTVAIGGGACLCYLPTVLARQLGEYEKAGLAVELVDLKGGSDALKAVLGGSADVVSGYFDHTVNLAAKKQEMQSFVVYDRYPGLVLVVSPSHNAAIKSIQDLAGKKVGVSAPGSSTDFFLKYLLKKNGVAASDVAVIGVGLGATAINALKSGQIDAISNTDPVMTRLEQDNSIKVLADTRTMQGTMEVWGAPLPAGCLHAAIEFVQKNPHTVQALANAIVRADKWIAKASATDVARVVPESYLLGDRALYLFSYDKVKEAISPDGLFSDAGAKATVRALAAFDPSIKPAEIDLAKTYTNEFARKANAKYK